MELENFVQNIGNPDWESYKILKNIGNPELDMLKLPKPTKIARLRIEMAA
jgi:hypothetical protein